MSLVPAGREREPVFSGLIVRVRFGQEGGRPLAQLEGERKRRSFQREERTYGMLVREALAPYQGAYIWNGEGRDEAAGRFLLQYEESDWAFLKGHLLAAETVPAAEPPPAGEHIPAAGHPPIASREAVPGARPAAQGRGA